jgi:hypothetical protein
VKASRSSGPPTKVKLIINLKTTRERGLNFRDDGVFDGIVLPPDPTIARFDLDLVV